MSTELKGFVITMSRGEKIQLDSDEMAKVIHAMQTGSACKLRQGLFNPSFYISIAEDTKRMKDFRSDLNSALTSNKRDKEYNGGKFQKEIPVFKPLKDVFADVPMQLESNAQKLGGGN